MVLGHSCVGTYWCGDISVLGHSSAGTYWCGDISVLGHISAGTYWCGDTSVHGHISSETQQCRDIMVWGHIGLPSPPKKKKKKLHWVNARSWEHIIFSKALSCLPVLISIMALWCTIPVCLLTCLCFFLFIAFLKGGMCCFCCKSFHVDSCIYTHRYACKQLYTLYSAS